MVEGLPGDLTADGRWETGEGAEERFGNRGSGGGGKMRVRMEDEGLRGTTR